MEHTISEYYFEIDKGQTTAVAVLEIILKKINKYWEEFRQKTIINHMQMTQHFV